MIKWNAHILLVQNRIRLIGRRFFCGKSLPIVLTIPAYIITLVSKHLYKTASSGLS